MRKRGILLMMMLTMVFLCVGCSFGTGKEDMTSAQIIIVTDGTMDMEEISQAAVEALKSNDQSVTVEDVKHSEENKYVVTIRTKLTEDEVLSVLKGEAWVQKAEINYELTMY